MTTEYPRVRRDQIRVGDIIASSHGYNVLVTEVWDGAANRADDRTVAITGYLHANPELPQRVERYPACSTVQRVRRACEQRCGKPSEVYAMDSGAGGWGGWYCQPCATALRFTITDRL
jgi:hypothetical protein